MKIGIISLNMQKYMVFIIIGITMGCSRNASEDSEIETDSNFETDSGDSDTTTTDGIDSEFGTDSVDSGGLPPCMEVEDLSIQASDSQNLFDYDHVPTFDIYLPDAQWDSLLADATAEEYVPVYACFEGKRIGSIGLRFKGSYGTLYNCFDETGELICPRLSLKMKFNKYADDQRFFGMKRLNFNANRYDDSRMKEKLAYDLYRSMGITAPRAAWAVIRVNGESLGLYGMVEELDGRFTANRWPENPDANLYKELWPTDIDEADILYSMKTNEDIGDIAGFLEFSEAFATATSDAQRLDILDAQMGLDYLARYMAVDDAILSYDGVTYFYTDSVTTHNHNYYLYEDAPSHFTLIPWDVESSFWLNPEHAAPHWTVVPEDCSLTYPYWGGLAIAPGCDSVFHALNSNLQPWRNAARELLDGPFALDTILAQIDRHASFIGEEARAPETPTMYTNFDSAVNGLRGTISSLRENLEMRIAAE